PNLFDTSGKQPPANDDPDLAWFIVTANKQPRGYFARKCSENGAISPAFILAAYAMDDRTTLKIHEEVVIWSKAALSTQWGQAVDGVGALMGSQESQVRLSRKVAQALPEGVSSWTEVKLDGDPPTNGAPPTVLVNLFVPVEKD